MKKLNCLLIGNCQNDGIMYYLSQSDEFSKTYEMKHYTNWQLIKNNCEIPMNDIQNSDLFIFQPLRIVHGCYSTDPTVVGSIGSYVKDDCVKISYPYVFSSSMWPLVQKAQNQNIWFGGEVIDKLILEGLEKNDILNLYHQNKIDWQYKTRFEKSINILKEKEAITDIKISNFIEKNLKDILLFLIPQHPTSIIFLNIANQILEKLNMKKLNFEERVLKFVNERNLPDSTYNHSSNMHPLHISLILDFDFKYGNNYLNGSQKFYEQRIIDYLYLNGHN
jgi:hypothetical protein